MNKFSKVLLGEVVETAEDAADIILASVTYTLLLGEEVSGTARSVISSLLLLLLPLGCIRFFINYRMQTYQAEVLRAPLETEAQPLQLIHQTPPYEKPYVIYPAVAQALLDANAFMYVLVQKIGITIPAVLLPVLLANGACHGYVIYGSGQQSLKMSGKKSPSFKKEQQAASWLRACLSVPAIFESFIGYPGGIFASVSYIATFLGATSPIANLWGGGAAALTLFTGASSAEYDKVSSLQAFTYWQEGYDAQDPRGRVYGKTLEFLFQQVFFALYAGLKRCEKTCVSYYDAKRWANLIIRPIMLSGLHFYVMNACLQLYFQRPLGYAITLNDKTLSLELRISALLFVPIMFCLGAANAAMEAKASDYHWAKKALLFFPEQENEGALLHTRIEQIEAAGKPILQAAPGYLTMN